MPKCQIVACDNWSVDGCVTCGRVVCARHGRTGLYHIFHCDECTAKEKADDSNINKTLGLWGLALVLVGGAVIAVGYAIDVAGIGIAGAVVGVIGLLIWARLFLRVTA